jgi:ABC-2 type transport system permease protein
MLPASVSRTDVEMFRSLVANFDAMTPKQVLLYYVVHSNLPFYLLMPSVIPTVISSYSIVGERKSGTLEPLLATPASSFDILLGKSLAAVLPAIAMTIISFLIYMTLVNTMTYATFGYALLPDMTWLVTVFITAPLLALMSVYLSILVSSKVTDIRAAQQISAVFVIPIMAVFVLQLFGYMSLNIWTLFGLSFMLLLIDVVLMIAGSTVFKREEILTKWA